MPQKQFPGYPSPGAVRPAAPGERYRVTVMGPGVTPLVEVEVKGLGRFDPERDKEFDARFDEVMAGDTICKGER